MKNLLLTLLLISPVFGQVTYTLSGSSTVKPGGTVTLTGSIGGVTATGPAAVQFTLSPPTGFTVTQVNPSASTTAASKTITCDSTSTLLCIVFGVNQNVLSNGALNTFVIQAPNTPGPSNFTTTNLVAVDKAGNNMAVVNPPSFTINVTSKADINNDGVVNDVDISLMRTQILNRTCTDDQDGDGKCNIVDLMIVALRSLGF